MMFKTDKLGNWIIKAIIIFLLIISTSLIISNYHYTRSEEVINNVGDKAKEILEKVNCEVKFKDFYYKGFCIEKDDMWNFLREQYNKTLEKDLEV